MLIKCPECELQVSDKAYACPHCGYPLKNDTPARKKKATNKRRRLPNGFGQISEIKGQHLRNPFRAMVTIGKKENGQYIRVPLKPEAYFPTYNAAYEALLEYNRNPYDLSHDITVHELYERWSDDYFKSIAKSSQRTIESAWQYCSALYDMRVKDIRARHIKGIMEDGVATFNGEERAASANTKARIKSLFNLMLDYAVEYEIVDHNYARTFDISENIIKEREDAKRGHIAFTESEIECLWRNLYTVEWVDAILFQCYSGWRPQELGLLKIENVNLEDGYIIGGMKTDAGTDRIVPIHSRIREIVQRRYDEAIALGSDYLFNCTDTQTHRGNYMLTYEKYRYRHNAVCAMLDLNKDHRAHDGRKHFVTMAKKYKVDEYAIKYIVGHKITDVTETVYTVRDNSWLTSEIEKIK